MELLDQSCQILVAPHTLGQAYQAVLLTLLVKVKHSAGRLNRELDGLRIEVMSIRLYSRIGCIVQVQVSTARAQVAVMGVVVGAEDNGPYLLM